MPPLARHNCCPHPLLCSTLEIVGNHILLKPLLRPNPKILDKGAQQQCSLLLHAAAVAVVAHAAQHATAVAAAHASRRSFPALASRYDGGGGEDGEEGEEGEGGKKGKTCNDDYGDE